MADLNVKNEATPDSLAKTRMDLNEKYGPTWGELVFADMMLYNSTQSQAIIKIAKAPNAPLKLKQEAETATAKIDPVLRSMGYQNWTEFRDKRLNRNSPQYWVNSPKDELKEEAIAAGIIKKEDMGTEAEDAALDRFKQQLMQMDNDYYREGLVKEYEKENPTQSLLMKIVFPNLYSRLTDDIRTGQGPTSWGDMGAGDWLTLASDAGTNIAPTVGGVSGNVAFKAANKGKMLPTTASNTLRMMFGGAEGGAYDVLGRKLGTNEDVGLTDWLEVPMMAAINGVAMRSAAKKASNVVEDAGNLAGTKVSKSKNIFKTLADNIENAAEDPVLAAGDELAAITNVPDYTKGFISRDTKEKLEALRNSVLGLDVDTERLENQALEQISAMRKDDAVRAELAETLANVAPEKRAKVEATFWGAKAKKVIDEVFGQSQELLELMTTLDHLGLLDDKNWKKLVDNFALYKDLPGERPAVWSPEAAAKASQAKAIVQEILGGGTFRDGVLWDNAFAKSSAPDIRVMRQREYPAISNWYDGLKIDPKPKNPDHPIKKPNPTAVVKVAEPGVAGNVIKSAIINPAALAAYDVGRYNLVTVPNMEDSEGNLEKLLKQKPDGIRHYAEGKSQFILPNDQALTPTELKLLDTLKPSNESLLQSIKELEKERKQSEKPKFRTGTGAAGIRG